MKKTLEDIASKFLKIETLDTRNSDRLDFYTCSVWGIRDALEAAYKAGDTKGYVDATNKEFPDFSAMCHKHGCYPCEFCHPKEYKDYYDSICNDCGFRHPGGTCMDS